MKYEPYFWKLFVNSNDEVDQHLEREQMTDTLPSIGNQAYWCAIERPDFEFKVFEYFEQWRHCPHLLSKVFSKNGLVIKNQINVNYTGKIGGYLSLLLEWISRIFPRKRKICNTWE